MQASTQHAILNALLSCCLSTANASGLEGLNSESLALIEEYRAHHGKLKEFYCGYSCDVTLLSEGGGTPSPTLSTRWVSRGEFKFRGNDASDGNMYRLTGTIARSSFILIATPQRYHLFEKSPKTDAYFVRGTGKGVPSTFTDEYYFPSAPYYSGGILDQSGHRFRVTKVLVRQEQGEELVDVHEEGPLYGATSYSVFTFFRNRHWATKEYLNWNVVPVTDEDVAQKSLRYSLERETLEYEGEVDGIPILRKLVQARGFAPFGTNDVDHSQVFDPGPLSYASRLTLTVDNFVPGPPPVSEFDPAPIISKIGGLGTPTPPSWRSWLLALNGLLLLAFGLFLLRKQRNTSPLNSSSDISPNGDPPTPPG